MNDVAAIEVGADRAKIRANALLEEIYLDVYERILDEVPGAEFPRLLEIGSGGGFFREAAPHATTSDCVAAPGIDRVVDACKLHESFVPGELDAIAAFNVFHHLHDPAGFLRGASHPPERRPSRSRRALVHAGRSMVLPRDPPRAERPGPGLLGRRRRRPHRGGANTRLPTSVFRDSDARFASEFPDLSIAKREPFHKWLYLFSGGLRLNTRVPRPIARPLVRVDRRVRLGDKVLGIFAVIVVRRT